MVLPGLSVESVVSWVNPMAGYPMSHIAEKLDEINKRLQLTGAVYNLDVDWTGYYRPSWDQEQKAVLILYTGPAKDWFDTRVYQIPFDDINAGRIDLRLQEIVKFGDGWLQRLLGLENELAIDALPEK